MCDLDGHDSGRDDRRPRHAPAPAPNFQDATEKATGPPPPPRPPSMHDNCPRPGRSRELRGGRAGDGRAEARGSDTAAARVTLTFLAVAVGPAPVVVLVVDGGLLAQRLRLHRPWTQVPTLLLGFVPHDVVVGDGVQDQGPVHCGQVAEVSVLLDPDGPTGDVPQIVKPYVLEVGHLEDDQGVVVEELPSADDREVREEVAEALEAGHAEQQQVLGDDRELGEAVAPVVLGLGDEQDVQVTLDHRAVLQAPQLLVVIADVDAGPADWRDTRGQGHDTAE